MAKQHIVLVLAAALLASYCGASFGEEKKAAEIPKEIDGLPMVFEEDFEAGCENWVPTDPKAWKILEENGNHVYSLFTNSDYSPPVRSPLSISLVKGLDIGDFVLEARVKQTGKEYGHRDFCLFFGHKDPSHYYYVHIATKADAHANSIFIVNDKPRVSIAKERTGGTKWDNKWHQVRVKRNTESGLIQVFFDDMEEPIMTAEDKTFTSGTIGFGSFDDTGNVDDIRIWANKK